MSQHQIDDTLRNQIESWSRASSIVFSQRKYRAIGAATFVVFATLYLFTLPATYTGGRVGLVSLRLLTPTLATFSVIMAGLVAVIVSFTAYTIRLGGSASSATTTTGFVGSVLPPLLCCSPLLPILAASVVGVFPAAFGVSGFIQGVMATYEVEILTGATLVLVYAATQNANGVTECSV
ncbi:MULTISPECIES: hypothetical protein [Halobacteriales]|uniref:Yip1 domain-containing protein n=1 Tax=Halorussus aquaticus TaxID=2953748 RepID=A0ABD5Q7R2_9EURY|nr:MULTISPECIES: hypothetical protein [Halobacteriales]USZ78536.1 hypothetical protein NGM07_23915 [Halorussus vallis]